MTLLKELHNLATESGNYYRGARPNTVNRYTLDQLPQDVQDAYQVRHDNSSDNGDAQGEGNDPEDKIKIFHFKDLAGKYWTVAEYWFLDGADVFAYHGTLPIAQIEAWAQAEY